jgi:hypothetical protein
LRALGRAAERGPEQVLEDEDHGALRLRNTPADIVGRLNEEINT